MLDNLLAAEGLRNRDALAPHSLAGFALTVPNLEAGENFYRRFGLGTAASPDGLEIAAAEGPVVDLYLGGERRFHHLSFAVFDDDLESVRKRLVREGIAQVDSPRQARRDACWFHDPDGHLVEVYAGERRAPIARGPVFLPSVPAGVAAAPDPDRHPAPRRLGHCLLFSPDVVRMVSFYERALGLRLSDKAGDLIAFMHTPHGSDHHVLAFAKSERPGFHHASFAVDGPDDIGLGAAHMRAAGFTEGWGLGRHYIGSNLFHYVRDPWGSFAEYFCDIDYIAVDTPWPARDVDPKYALHVWGPDVPPSFFENHEGEAP